jgi:dihydrofolate synthase/folylpolyglutamate synthase
MIELLSADSKIRRPTRVLISFSKRPVNEVEVMMKSMTEFFGNESRLVLCSFEHRKALELESIHFLESKINKISKGLLDFVTDWKTDLKNTKNQKILVCGSYYFVGEVQRFILSHS